MEELMYTCELCNKEVNTSRSYMLDGKMVCRSCQIKATRTKEYEYDCNICGKHVIQSSRKFHEGKLICNECDKELKLQRPDTYCINCNKLITSSRIYHDSEGKPVCRSCSLRETYTNKYGSMENYSQHMHEALTKTLQSKYGDEVTSSMKVPGALEKQQITNLERYGATHNWSKDSSLRSDMDAKLKEIQNKPEVIAKRKATNQERYGGSSPSCNPEVMEKYHATMQARYGVDHNWSKGELRDKIIKDFIESHPGYSHWTQLPEVKERSKSTNLERYGYENVNQSPEIKARSKEARKKLRNSPEHLEKRIRSAVMYHNLDYVSQSVREDGETVVTYKCKTCGTEFNWCQADDPRHPYCHECSSKGKSIQEAEIKRFLMDIIPDEEIILHNRSILHGKELDFYLPNRNLAIEFDGTYWHNGVDNSYKFEECRKSGIRLIRISEYDWWQRRDKIHSLIRSVLGLYDTKIGARKCIAKEIDSDTYREFMEDYHLQGYAPASIRIGLFYKDELVQVEGYGAYRYTGDKSKKPRYEYELIRECSKSGYNILGGKSKLQSYFISKYNPHSILSFCHKDKFTGNSYLKSGYRLIRETSPGYMYYKNGFEYSRITFQKYKMPGLVGTLLDTYDPNLTEIQNMDLNGYFRLYDYGNYVFLWTKGD